MQTLYDWATSLRSSCISDRRRAKQLDPMVQAALAATLRTELSAVDIASLDTALDEARTCLNNLTAKRDFVALRHDHYAAHSNDARLAHIRELQDTMDVQIARMRRKIGSLQRTRDRVEVMHDQCQQVLEVTEENSYEEASPLVPQDDEIELVESLEEGRQEETTEGSLEEIVLSEQ